MDFAANPVLKATERYWVLELRTVFLYGLNDRKGDEFKTGNTHINVATKFCRYQKTWLCLSLKKSQWCPLSFTITKFRGFKPYTEV